MRCMWPFTRKQTAPAKSDKPSVMAFKGGQAFFEYQCKYGHTAIVPGETVVALVLDASKEYGTPTPVSVRDDGTQTAMIRVASHDGGFVVPARTASGKGTRLKPDDVVLWVPRVRGVPFTSDERSAWTGVIVAVVAPELDPRAPEFRILSKFA